MTKTKQTPKELTWFDSISNMYKKYGFLGILKILVITILMAMTAGTCFVIMKVANDPGIVFKEYTEWVNTNHAKEQECRLHKDIELKNLLPVMLRRYDSDRVWIIQYHNGTLDWQHGTMRFELCKDGIESVKEYYNDFNITWLALPYYLRQNDLFIGDIEELRKIDKVLAEQLSKSEVEYLACIVIRDCDGYPIGIFGNTWVNMPDNIELSKIKIYKNLLEDSGQIKTLIQTKK